MAMMSFGISPNRNFFSAIMISSRCNWLNEVDSVDLIKNFVDFLITLVYHDHIIQSNEVF